DVVALALGFRAYAAAFVDRRLRDFGALRRSALAAEWVRHQDRGDTPRGDRALRIGFEHVAKRLFACRVPERVQHHHRPLERSLDVRIATGGKGDLPERTALRVGVVRLRCGDGESNGKGKKSNAQLHCVLPDVTRGGARTLLRGGALRKGGLDQRTAQ